MNLESKVINTSIRYSANTDRQIREIQKMFAEVGEKKSVNSLISYAIEQLYISMTDKRSSGAYASEVRNYFDGLSDVLVKNVVEVQQEYFNKQMLMMMKTMCCVEYMTALFKLPEDLEKFFWNKKWDQKFVPFVAELVTENYQRMLKELEEEERKIS